MYTPLQPDQKAGPVLPLRTQMLQTQLVYWVAMIRMYMAVVSQDSDSAQGVTGGLFAKHTPVPDWPVDTVVHGVMR